MAEGNYFKKKTHHKTEINATSLFCCRISINGSPNRKFATNTPETLAITEQSHRVNG